jgi:REP element-mobilizing transposase RayT
MARGCRSDLPGPLFHAFARGVDGTAIYRDDDDRRWFLGLLLSVVERFRWRVHALCLMTTHYHVVVEAATSDLSSGMQRLNGVYAQRFNRRHARAGHLFGDRFGTRAIEREEHLAEVCRYVVANPVRAGLCSRASDWRPWVQSRYGLDGP